MVFTVHFIKKTLVTVNTKISNYSTQKFLNESDTEIKLTIILSMSCTRRSVETLLIKHKQQDTDVRQNQKTGEGQSIRQTTGQGRDSQDRETWPGLKPDILSWVIHEGLALVYSQCGKLLFHKSVNKLQVLLDWCGCGCAVDWMQLQPIRSSGIASAGVCAVFHGSCNLGFSSMSIGSVSVGCGLCKGESVRFKQGTCTVMAEDMTV